MEGTTFIEVFYNNLSEYLVNKQNIRNDINIFRTHNNKLDINGDISFPLNVSAWKKIISNNGIENTPIFNYLYRQTDNLEIFNDLINNSRHWTVCINKCNIEHEKVNIFLNRSIAFKNVITNIISQGKKYGFCNLITQPNIEIRVENEENNLSLMDLTQLRINLLRNVLNNLLNITGNPSSTSEIIYLTNKSESTIEGKKIVCGVVISNKFGKKNTKITAQEYYNKRTIDMRLMAQHKYGLRVNTEPGWTEFFEKLGTAAVIIDLLHVKPSRSLVINIDDATFSYSKGASFILYNCARLSTIFKQFEQKVDAGHYPPLPDLNEIDVSLLNQPEEWEILFVYLLQYPQIVKSCLKDIHDCKFHIHNLCSFLDSMCSVFSIYYRRVRILTDPRSHLFPVLQARIYLLKAVQEVLHNALSILNIPPVKQM